MKVVCAWCERQGRPSLLREKEPRGGGVTHGICDDHIQLLLAELGTRRPPSAPSAVRVAEGAPA